MLLTPAFNKRKSTKFDQSSVCVARKRKRFNIATRVAKYQHSRGFAYNHNSRQKVATEWVICWLDLDWFAQQSVLIWGPCSPWHQKESRQFADFLKTKHKGTTHIWPIVYYSPLRLGCEYCTKPSEMYRLLRSVDEARLHRGSVPDCRWPDWPWGWPPRWYSSSNTSSSAYIDGTSVRAGLEQE